jgi:hypothetical protein
MRFSVRFVSFPQYRRESWESGYFSYECFTKKTELTAFSNATHILGGILFTEVLLLTFPPKSYDQCWRSFYSQRFFLAGSLPLAFPSKSYKWRGAFCIQRFFIVVSLPWLSHQNPTTQMFGDILYIEVLPSGPPFLLAFQPKSYDKCWGIFCSQRFFLEASLLWLSHQNPMTSDGGHSVHRGSS